ncbi:MAG TPA: adenylate/guanylate cyclase domain-containing protein [Myxococcota bacterium]|nr:adenylate/guanylate cyclase domain-containing protein [Myxococcota bacterium]
MPPASPPETRFATVSRDRVAYQIVGDGPRDLVHTIGLWSQVDVILDDPTTQRYLRRLATTHRVILFDARGTGLSDERPADGRTIAEHWAEDLLAVLDAAGSRAPSILGIVDAGPLLLRFLELHPERCSRLVLFSTSARFAAAPDYPIGFTPEQLERFYDFLHTTWGHEKFVEFFVPSVVTNEPLRRWVARWCRAQASPGTAVANVREIAEMDGRPGLAALGIPVLVMSRRDYAMIPASHGRYLAEHVPGARFVLLPGADGLPIFETPEAILDQIEEFLTGSRQSEPERVLATVLFTDIADSTRRAAELGDAAWRQLLDRHDRVLREQLGLHRGRLVESAGDGALATFDRPDQAIECALSLHRALDALGVAIRAGLHTGSVELREDGRVGGMAVHIGARVVAAAQPGEVLVSRTVRDVLLGSRYAFAERGEHELKGVPERFALYAVDAG